MNKNVRKVWKVLESSKKRWVTNFFNHFQIIDSLIILLLLTKKTCHLFF